MLAFRPVHPSIGRIADPREWVVTNARAKVNGRDCLIIENSGRPYSRSPLRSEFAISLWIDPDLEYSVVKCVLYNGAQVIEEQVITHEEDTTFGWLPSRWTRRVFHRMGNRDVYNEVRCTVRRFALNTDAPPMPKFEASLPDGVRVNDQIVGRQWTKTRHPNGGTEHSRFGDETAENWRREFTIPLLVATGIIAVPLVVFFIRKVATYWR
jgi:hypothetical protein